MLALIILQAAIQVAVGNLERQMQGTKHQLTGIVPGVVGTVTEKKLFGMKATDGPADMVTQGKQTGRVHGTLLKTGLKNGWAILNPKQRRHTCRLNLSRRRESNGQAAGGAP